MKRSQCLLLAAATAAFAVAPGCGDNSKICGPGTTDKDGVCTPTETPPMCSDGTILDPSTNSCVIDPDACQNGTVLINNRCVDPTDGLVSQFQVVADVDPTATIPELDDHLDTLDLTDAGDVDPHDLVDRVDGDDSTGADTGADPDDATDADTTDADTTDDTVDLGFGSGDGATDDGLSADVVEPGGLDELDAAFADLDATLAVDVGADLDATSLYEDPAGFDDPYLAPDPIDRDPGDADDLDADNGNWDGDFSHDDGHGML